MIIRPAGSFFTIEESMERSVEVQSLQELKEHILDVFGCVFNLDSLQCRFYCDDDRIGWHTYLITGDYADGSYKQQAIFFADSPMSELPAVVVEGAAISKAPKRRFIIVKEIEGGSFYLDSNMDWKPSPPPTIADCKIYECTLLEAREQAFATLSLVTDPLEKPLVFPVEVISAADNSDNVFFRPLRQ